VRLDFFSVYSASPWLNDPFQRIGYTNIYPVERLLRDARLIMIWTGTNEIMDLVLCQPRNLRLWLPTTNTRMPPVPIRVFVITFVVGLLRRT